MLSSEEKALKAKINSNHIKLALLSYFRYRRQWVAATEVQTIGMHPGDVVVDTGELIHEVEVKISFQDLKNEFIQKRNKHMLLESGNMNINKFSFCVPFYLVEITKHFLKDKNCTAGIISYDPTRYSYWNQPKDYIVTIKKSPIYSTGYNETIRKNIVMRLSSELCCLYGERWGKQEYDSEDQIYFNFLEK